MVDDLKQGRNMSRILVNALAAYRWAGLRYASRYFCHCALKRNQRWLDLTSGEH